MTEAFIGRDVRTVEPLDGSDPQIGQWLWAMQEARRGLLEAVEGIGAEQLDWRGPSGADNSIGSLLYHVALIEASWLYDDIFMREYPEDIIALFPLDHRTTDGRLMHVPDLPLTEHLQRLSFVRGRFLELVGAMAPEEWRRVRAPEGEDYAVSPAWVVYHLVEHEAGHLFELRAGKRRWRELRGPG